LLKGLRLLKEKNFPRIKILEMIARLKRERLIYGIRAASYFNVTCTSFPSDRATLDREARDGLYGPFPGG
jgi:hypothetical protein